MYKLRMAMARFMQGRYGRDSLNTFLCILALVLLIVNLFVNTPVLSILTLLVIGCYTFRGFSRRIPQRQAENERYRRIQSRVTGWFMLQKNRWRDRRTHVYRRCPHCHAVIRLSKASRGTHTCTCPHCRKDFSVKI